MAQWDRGINAANKLTRLKESKKESNKQESKKTPYERQLTFYFLDPLVVGGHR